MELFVDGCYIFHRLKQLIVPGFADSMKHAGTGYLKGGRFFIHN
jgi:hypothetical protein